MTQLPNHATLSFRGLELFQIYARQGSLRATAAEAGLSISTVAHHLRALEEQVGAALFDRDRKPMVLTPKGRIFLRNIGAGLETIRKAKAEASAGDAAQASYLRAGAIEDFESDVIPALAVHLRQKMPLCEFLFHTASSHDIIAGLRSRELDVGIATTPPEALHDLRDLPLLHDPFVIAMPASSRLSLEDVVAGQAKLPFLQFSGDLMIAGQIAAQLRRLGVELPHKFACTSNQTLMALVAQGAGWAITTPLLYARAQRFHGDLRLLPFPGKRFARRLSLVATPDCAPAVLDLVDQQVRHSLQGQVIDPLCDAMPWLGDQFHLMG